VYGCLGEGQKSFSISLSYRATNPFVGSFSTVPAKWLGGLEK
jgi:hypothetical protein